MKKFLSSLLTPAPILTFVAIAALVILRLLFTPVHIQTGSMEPVLPVGTIVFIQPSESLKPGDIITFQQVNAPRPTTHTFIGYDTDGSLKTKGDANDAPDVRAVPLQHSDVIGKAVFSLPFLTSVYWTSVRGVLSLGVIGLMAIAILAVYVRSRRWELRQDSMQVETPAPSPV